MVLEKFIEMRTQVPESGDLIDGLKDRPCYSLHSGRYRAATWYDADSDVVWLLAAGIHRSGSHDDFYNVAIQLEQAGHLYPTTADFENVRAQNKADRLEREALRLRQLRDEVVAAPESGMREYNGEDNLHAEIWAEVIQELALVAVRIRIVRLSDQWLTDAELAILLAGALGSDPHPRPEDDWRYQSFEAYIPLLPSGNGDT